MELKDYLRILRRRWWTVLLVSGLVLGFNYYLSQRKPQIFRATADIIIKQPTEQYVIVQGGPTSVWESLSYETRLSLIKSEPVLGAAMIRCRNLFPNIFKPPQPGEHRRRFVIVRHAGSEGPTDVREIKDGPPPLEPREVAEGEVEVGEAAFSDGISIVKEMVDWAKAKDSEIVTIFVTGQDGDFTRQLADAVATSTKMYIERDKRERVTRTLRFIRNQKELATQEFQKFQGEIEAVREARSARDGGGDSIPWSSGEVEEVRRQLLTQREQRLRLEKESTMLKKYLGERVAPGSGNRLSVTETLLTQRHMLEAQLASLLLSHTESHPIVLAKKAELERFREEMKETERTMRREARVGSILEQSDTLVSKQQELELLDAQIKETDAEYQKRLKAVEEARKKLVEHLPPAARIDFASKEFQLDIAKSALVDWLKVERDLLTQVELQVGLVDLVTAAKPGGELPRDGGAKIPFVLLVGLVLGIGGAYALEYLNTTIRGEYDVRRYVNLPLLGMILRIKKPEERLLLNISSKATMHEIFNTIGTLIETYAQEHQAQIFMVASSRAEEGKSTVTSNIGIALARSGVRVILVDCDLRKAVLHRFFGLDNTQGLSTWLNDISDPEAPIPLDKLIRPTEVEGLRVVTAGPHPQNPVILLKSDRFRRLLQLLREQADVVLVDVPPVNIAVDTMLLAPFVDGIVLLISSGETSKDEVTYAKRLLEGSRGKFIGCVLNKVTLESHGYYYYYYYYDSYKYYRER